MRNGRVWLIVLFLAAPPALAQDESVQASKRAAFRELFQESAADQKLEAMIRSQASTYTDRMKQLHPELSQVQLETLRKGIEDNLMATKENYVVRQEDLYIQRLSMEDLRAAIAFYKTPEGKRLSAISLDMIPDYARTQSEWVSAAVHKATVEMNNVAKAPQ
jgi:hypothetical protein